LFENLTDLQKYKFPPSVIFDMDECGLWADTKGDPEVESEGL
jgi:hypothetical protein